MLFAIYAGTELPELAAWLVFEQLISDSVSFLGLVVRGPNRLRELSRTVGRAQATGVRGPCSP